MKHTIPITLSMWVGIMVGAFTVAYLATTDPKLDACAREHNVYACEYVAQPMKANLLPPPEKE